MALGRHVRLRPTPGPAERLRHASSPCICAGALDGEWALKLDVWSFGVTLWEVLERRRPFEGLSQHAVQASVGSAGRRIVVWQAGWR